MIPLFRWCARCPLWLLQGLGAVLGWLAFLLSPTYRRRFVDHLRQAGYGWRQGWPAVAQAGRLVAELPRLWLGLPVPVQWSGEGCIDRALEAKRGVVFLTPHLGCFEITAQAYAERYGHRQPMTVLFRPPRKRWLQGLLATARERPGLHAVPTKLSGVKQMLAALRRGEAVGLLPDQVPPLGQGVWASFFGRPAYTMTLSARLAAQTGATVLLAWGERLSWGRGYRIHVQPLSHPLAQDLQDAATQINQAMEQLIACCPQQYLWGYARYKPPGGA